MLLSYLNALNYRERNGFFYTVKSQKLRYLVNKIAYLLAPLYSLLFSWFLGHLRGDFGELSYIGFLLLTDKSTIKLISTVLVDLANPV